MFHHVDWSIVETGKTKNIFHWFSCLAYTLILSCSFSNISIIRLDLWWSHRRTFQTQRYIGKIIHLLWGLLFVVACCLTWVGMDWMESPIMVGNWYEFPDDAFCAAALPMWSCNALTIHSLSLPIFLKGVMVNLVSFSCDLEEHLTLPLTILALLPFKTVLSQLLDAGSVLFSKL